MKRLLNVWWDDRLVGQLTQNQHGELGFAYASTWLDDEHAPPLSISLPKRAKAFTHRECRPFFSGLLPEADSRESAAQALGVSSANDFALLDHLGGDVAGAIQILQTGVNRPFAGLQSFPTVLNEAGLVRVLDALPTRPFLVGQGSMRLSLAGAHPKLPVVLVNGAVALPAPGQPTTHILKPPISRFKATTENETFVMRLAEAIGLDVARVEPRLVSGRPFLLVKRYDRAAGDDGQFRRIHQEDFCQALGVPPDRKYAAEGGPTFKACFELLRRVAARPAVDVLKLLDAAIFNAMVGNADAHGKNFSIVHDSDGPRLAPLYDLLSTVFYPDLGTTFAMKIGTRATLGELDADGWTRFAKDAGMTLPMVRRRVEDLRERIDSAIASVVSELGSHQFDQTVVESLARMTQTRASGCATSIFKR